MKDFEFEINQRYQKIFVLKELKKLLAVNM